MNGLINFLLNNVTLEYGSLVAAITLGIIWTVCYDFYHLLFSAVLSWFKK